MAPAALWLFVFLVLPFIAMVVFAFGERAPEGGYQAAFTFAQFANLPSRAAAFTNTLMLAPIGAAALPARRLSRCLLSRASRPNPRHRLLLVSLVIVPFWTSLLVRTYAWMYHPRLARHSASAGHDRPRRCPADQHARRRAARHRLRLPAADDHADLLSASKSSTGGCSTPPSDLGAKPLTTFLGVTLPLSLPGVMTGMALVTILLLGEYLIPQLLGGGKVFFIGNALVDLFLQSRNWPFGSAIAVTLVVVVVIVLAVAMRIAWRVAGTRQVDLV